MVDTTVATLNPLCPYLGSGGADTLAIRTGVAAVRCQDCFVLEDAGDHDIDSTTIGICYTNHVDVSKLVVR
jgi:hypothetical protein